MVSEISKDEIRSAIEDKLSAYFCVTSEDATDDQVFQSAAMVLREIMSRFRPAVVTDNEITVEKLKKLVDVYANPKDIGTFKKVNKTEVAGNNEGEDHGIVIFECQFTEKKVGVGISFDMDMKLTGITLGS